VKCVDESTERNHYLALVSSVVVVVHIMAMNGHELLDRDKMSLEKSGVESASISSMYNTICRNRVNSSFAIRIERIYGAVSHDRKVLLHALLVN